MFPLTSARAGVKAAPKLSENARAGVFTPLVAGAAAGTRIRTDDGKHQATRVQERQRQHLALLRRARRQLRQNSLKDGHWGAASGRAVAPRRARASSAVVSRGGTTLSAAKRADRRVVELAGGPSAARCTRRPGATHRTQQPHVEAPSSSRAASAASVRQRERYAHSHGTGGAVRARRDNRRSAAYPCARSAACWCGRRRWSQRGARVRAGASGASRMACVHAIAHAGSRARAAAAPRAIVATACDAHVRCLLSDHARFRRLASGAAAARPPTRRRQWQLLRARPFSRRC